ncbi:methyltransferase domain-containing protein [Amycolatopsis sp.]|uniref:methyltransferase domain-containing protein n=1 Tax=Amycolatopsis sp. TaxID=37632 RepID=UPI0026354FE0|nr:methyltransferase domain-containing protein [Amycolatopsis sp.]
MTLVRQQPSVVGTKLLEGRAQELSFPDDAFDACVSHMAFDLVPDVDPQLGTQPSASQ